jgi:hypothetical protein
MYILRWGYCRVCWRAQWYVDIVEWMNGVMSWEDEQDGVEWEWTYLCSAQTTAAAIGLATMYINT